MNAPKLRFKGFSNHWEPKLLEELYSIKNGLNKEKEAFGSGTPILNYMDVNKNTFIDINEIKGKVNLTNSEIERFLVKNNDLFFTRTSESSEEIGLTCSYVGENTDLVFSGFVLKASPKIKEIDSTFYSYYLRTFNKRKLIIKHSSITTRALTSGTLLSTLPINYTTIIEQQKIANFLKSIDYKIDLQREKIELLKEQKKGFMQKVFSQKLRFKDENGANFSEWVPIKLGDVGVFKSGFGFSEKYQGNKNSEFPFLKVSDMNISGNERNIVHYNNSVSKNLLKEMKLKPFTKPSIIFAKVGAAIFLERKRLINIPFLIDNNMMAFSLTKEYSIDFFMYLFETIRFSKFAQVGALPSYNGSDLANIKVLVPTLREQLIIVRALLKLDKKIDLEKEKYNNLTSQKQAFMQQMFI